MSEKRDLAMQDSGNRMVVFEDRSIRRVWHDNEWWFSVVDVCGVLTASPDPGAYWRKLKQRLSAEAGQPVTFCHGLKLQAPDGKQRETDCATTETRDVLLRIEAVGGERQTTHDRLRRCEGARA